ncbi:unnamed protein product [Prunus brigantina]
MMRMLMKALNNDNEATEQEALELLIELADTEPRFIKRQRERMLHSGAHMLMFFSSLVSFSASYPSNPWNHMDGDLRLLDYLFFWNTWIVINLFDFLPYEASVTCMQSSGNLEFESVAWTWTSESLDWHLAKPYNF